MSPVVAVLGLGEAGSLIAADLVLAGATVRGYDPKPAAARNGGGRPGVAVPEAADAARACAGAQLVVSVNSAADALAALEQGVPGCEPGAIWADLNTASPGRKREVADAAGDRVRVVDVALMAPVPPRGLATPMAASGPAAPELARLLGGLGATVEVIDGPWGAAATHKLLRSVFYKGLAAAVVEALAAARAAGLESWLRPIIVEELTRADESTVDRLVEGSRTHAARREHEMQAAAQLLAELGVPARVAGASRDWLRDLAREG